jgi:hypothetical protein
MGHPETILEKTDRMLSVLVAEKPSQSVKMDWLWQSGLAASPLFQVGEQPEASAEREAEGIVARHLDRQQLRKQPAAMAQLVEFQHTLQMRSKVISAIETLMRG